MPNPAVTPRTRTVRHLGAIYQPVIASLDNCSEKRHYKQPVHFDEKWIELQCFLQELATKQEPSHQSVEIVSV